VRGSPLLRALIAFAVILSLGYPLSRLTSGGPASAVAPAKGGDATSSEVQLQLSFTAVPRTVRVLHLGKELWNETAPEAAMERTLSLPYPKAGVDLQLQAEFADANATVAARVTLTDPQGDEHVRSLWGTGSIDDVATFP
jgi:hypothetical protein